jgi:hypothetical protein
MAGGSPIIDDLGLKLAIINKALALYNLLRQENRIDFA